MSINKVTISGNLTRDPEMRHTQNGMAVLGFGVAVNDRRKNQQTGEWEDCPNFIDCTMFGTRAESVSRFLSKGSKVAIEGRLRWSQWETKEGQKRSKVEVVVDEIEFMSRAQEQQPAYGAGYAPQPAPAYGAQQPAYASQQGYAQQPQGYAPQPAPAYAPAPSMQQQTPPLYDEDIPF